jgi:hypothetical protein
MDLIFYSQNEIRRRADLLPQEIGAWTALANANVNNFGIHRSQFEALKIMMDELLKQLTASLGKLSADLTSKQFAEQYLAVGDEIVGIQDLWQIFRHIFAQRENENYKRAVDAADLIAADCYLTCMNRAKEWGLVKEQQFREPPLTYFEAETSPSTAGRGNAVESLGFPVRRYRNMRLPIPIVLMPFDQVKSIWMFCNLHHEVGHNLDQDLNLREAFSGPLLARMTNAGIASERQKMWWRWSGEILADVFGIMLGGAGYAYSLCNWILILSPAAGFQELDAQGVHPPFVIRANLIAAMLRKLNITPLTQAADEITVELDKLQIPAWTASYIADYDLIADVFLNSKLEVLGNRSLSELNPELENDMKKARSVADCLPNNFGCPDPNFSSPSFPHRLVPVAAQMAVAKFNKPETAQLDAVQNNALKYLERINRPTFLAGISRSEFLRELAGKINLSRTQEKKPDE